MSDDRAPLWTPSPSQINASEMARFMGWLVQQGTLPAPLANSHALWQWSVQQPELFWEAWWRFVDVKANTRPDGTHYDMVLRGGRRMAPPNAAAGPQWFPGAQLNFAEHLLQRADDHPALVCWTEQGLVERVTYAQLAKDVAMCADALQRLGVIAGDRVAAWMPNVRETVVAMLAASAIGAVWSSCSPDFGADGVVDRFGQIEPVVLIVAAAYRYAGKSFALLERVAQVVQRLPSVRAVWVVPGSARDGVRPPSDSDRDTARLPTEAAETAETVETVETRPSLSHIPNAQYWTDVMRSTDAVESPRFTRLPFDHPLYILYSSGTTGLPKCIVHGAGGTLMQHLKEHVLHTDLRSTDTIFYFTTCGWMMWNWLVSALAVGSTVVLYDGAPMPTNDPAILWRMAEQEQVSVFGTSAKYLSALEKQGVKPREVAMLSALRTILSTGSPLAEHSYQFVYRDVKSDVQLCSISGGTDIVSCFALGDPTSPVYRGELQMRGLGMAVDVWNDAGESIRGEPGELVCTAPFPSMPVAFWNDPHGEKYSAAYFEHFPGVWRHGDWAELTAHDGLIIHGRSDTTLNPGGVRIGTSEIYRQVETMPEVLESVVTEHTTVGASGTDARVVLFVRLRPDVVLDDGLIAQIQQRIRSATSPHHVPRVVMAVDDIPRTRSGKISELAVRETINGRAVKNVEALANPESLAQFRTRAELSV